MCKSMFNILHEFLFKLDKILQSEYYYYPHFTYKNIEALKG